MLSLAFSMAYLVLQPAITAASTILGYERHMKYQFRENGCEPSEYNTPFLGQIRQGIQNVFPFQNDKRRALLLPKYLHRQIFNSATSKIPTFSFGYYLGISWDAETTYILGYPSIIGRPGEITR